VKRREEIPSGVRSDVMDRTIRLHQLRPRRPHDGDHRRHDRKKPAGTVRHRRMLDQSRTGEIPRAGLQVGCRPHY